jgi:hypothetical protein
VGEDGGELSKEEILKFRHLLRGTLYSPPSINNTPREERKKLPLRKTKEPEANLQRKCKLKKIFEMIFSILFSHSNSKIGFKTIHHDVSKSNILFIFLFIDNDH